MTGFGTGGEGGASRRDDERDLVGDDERRQQRRRASENVWSEPELPHGPCHQESHRSDAEHRQRNSGRTRNWKVLPRSRLGG